jgi:N-methylhydantoinase A
VGSFRAGVDIGGTFTDIVLLGDDGTGYRKKVWSMVDYCVDESVTSAA